ncbi:3-hydroxyacyl-CoA dehydrogenase NAD-binding domain-containing protein [Aliiglaciecola sp. 2_MG-2023]|uniref:3-hydroxyacyl-CoA dehydrogenase NAD-binding domain-containing protein n=1 Tax=unclassified Aliiglaciecola TaxID=2593648 RepID=UPI0026E25544|nr:MULTISPECIES: 3-hydroxyacyl-CoA dehydrogenase NAD-binding domain-containing protein [unclassified Aliiglaciecola]MDO6711724.1 3-hydroxyacyl-CoA dehydrogenase NAD-binding domain-containing protein [Aliiglaciecola sp. 2_MG-2023]MDO6752795.1 3-hydroxyacyl-CoA dehydrogenase NAD-binding domain-containing protein [Aliiglaciecola sp. 1_MG-2023]
MKFACIGLGNVGRSWAVTFARAGYQVRLWDKDPESLAKAYSLIRKALEDLTTVDPDFDVQKAFANVHLAETMALAVEDADYVQESTAENVNVKVQVFNALGDLAPEKCLLASSTSAIPASEFLASVSYPQRCLIVHPVNPPHIIPLVELCASPWTSPEVVQQAKSMMEQLGQSPIVLNKEIDGFVLNRLQWALLGEAMHLVGEGYCSVEDIDKVLTKGLALRWALMGPFEVGHLNATKGLEGYFDVLQDALKRVQGSLKTDYPPNSDLVSQAHDVMAKRIPVNEIENYQSARDQRLLKLRQHIDWTGCKNT